MEQCACFLTHSQLSVHVVVQRHRSRTKRLLNVQRDDVRPNEESNVQRDDVRPNEESSVLLMLDRLISKVTRRRVLSKAAVLVSWGVFVSSGERLLRSSATLP